MKPTECQCQCSLCAYQSDSFHYVSQHISERQCRVQSRVDTNSFTGKEKERNPLSLLTVGVEGSLMESVQSQVSWRDLRRLMKKSKQRKSSQNFRVLFVESALWLTTTCKKKPD